MPASQTSFTEDHGNGIAGQVADGTTFDADSMVAMTTNGIGFGVACKIHNDGTNDVAGHCDLGIASNKFVGISIIDPTRDPADGDEYPKGGHATVMWRGTAWVKVSAAVAVGDDVTAATTTGALSSATAGATQIAIADARFLTAAAANGLALVRLYGRQF